MYTLLYGHICTLYVSLMSRDDADVQKFINYLSITKYSFLNFPKFLPFIPFILLIYVYSVNDNHAIMLENSMLPVQILFTTAFTHGVHHHHLF